jgi:hypothetical protein
MDTSCHREQDRNDDFFPQRLPRGEVSQTGGDAMTNTTTRPKGISLSRALAFSAMLMGALLTILLLPAYGQQEVDPTWYDPWVAPNAAVIQSAQLPAAALSVNSPVPSHGYELTAKPLASASSASASSAAKERAQDTRVDHKRHIAEVAVDSKKRMALLN